MAGILRRLFGLNKDDEPDTKEKCEYMNTLKTTYDYYPGNTKQNLASVVNDYDLLYRTKRAKLSINHLQVSPDRRDPSKFVGLKDVKLIIEMDDDKCLILFGNIEIKFRPRPAPLAAQFYCFRLLNTEAKFSEVQGAMISSYFTDLPDDATKINEVDTILREIINDPRFVYNLNQFDEFMDVFKFYKSLSDELNNDKNYEINSKKDPYWFIPADVQGYETEFRKEIYDNIGILKGYSISETEYSYLPNEVKDRCELVIDIRIKGDNKDIQNIRKIGMDNIYLSNLSSVTQRNLPELRTFAIINIRGEKDEIVLTGSMKSDEWIYDDYSYLNLYDMGQKIKVESIENSLRLINQGGTGAASEMLEYLIGDKPIPNNGELVPSNLIKKYCAGLNDSQRRAFMMAVDGSPVSLIKGPPGTGKTHVINAITSYITKELKQKVVISSQTHIAIDNVLDKLMENHDPIIPNRITNKKNKYSGAEINSTLYKTWGLSFKKYNEEVSDTQLGQKIANDMKNFKGEERFAYTDGSNNEYSVIGATTTTSAIAGKKGLEVLKGYDWLIIDEVSKCPITEVLRYLPYVERIIMVGDDFQLAPLLEFSKDEVKDLTSYDEEKFDKLESIYENSVFAKVLKKAQASHRLVLLNENYRSTKEILGAYNIFYEGALVPRREEVKPEKVHFSSEARIDFESKDIFFVEVRGGQEANEGTSRFNIEEINATAEILRNLMASAINPKQISVSAIFPYAAQIGRFQKQNIKLINKAKQTFKNFEIDTVDAFQGKETDVVLVNTVVADSSKQNFLKDFRRINVMMSRAKDKLIIFGNSMVLKQIDMKTPGGEKKKYFFEIYKHIKNNGKLIEYKGGDITCR